MAKDTQWVTHYHLSYTMDDLTTMHAVLSTWVMDHAADDAEARKVVIDTLTNIEGFFKLNDDFNRRLDRMKEKADG
jgi:hypothetical protein